VSQQQVLGRAEHVKPAMQATARIEAQRPASLEMQGSVQTMLRKRL
jgi:hypothetical protein